MKICKIFLFFMIFLSGCQFAGILSPVITGVIIWKEGRAHKYYDLNTIVLYRAVKNTCNDLNIKITSDSKTKNGFYIVGKSKDNFSFYIEKYSFNVTDLSIRINTFGNKSYTEMIIHKIDENINLVNYDDSGKPVISTNFPIDLLTKNP